MGGKQGLQILADVARRLNREDRLWFLFCGQGPERAALEERCQGLTRVIFLDLQPAERLGALLGTADIHLLPQRAGAADLVMPSKLTGMPVQRPPGVLRRGARYGAGQCGFALRAADIARGCRGDGRGSAQAQLQRADLRNFGRRGTAVCDGASAFLFSPKKSHNVDCSLPEIESPDI